MTWKTKTVVEGNTLNDVLKKTTEFDLYSFYLGETIQFGKAISSPFREDKNPSFVFFKGNNGIKLKWHDFATGDSGDIVNFVQSVFNLTPGKALKRIRDDVSIGKITFTTRGISITEDLKTTKTIISIKRKNFTTIDDEYWGQYGLDRDDLRHFNVYPISHFWINDQPQPYSYGKKQPIYAYQIYDRFKIYRPNSKNRSAKWKTNTRRQDIQGWEQLEHKGDLLIITKSLKDVMVLHKLGYNSIAPSSESASLPVKIVNQLKERYKKIIILFDYDDGGMNGASKLNNKFGFDKIFIPYEYKEIHNAKDVSDFHKEFGKEKTIKMLKQIIC